MDYPKQGELDSEYRLEEALIDPLREPQPNEASRFFDYLDSPDNSDNEEIGKAKDFSKTFNLMKESEEIKSQTHLISNVVWIKNLPPKTSAMDIHKLWGQFGVINNVNIDHNNNFASVKFETKEAAEKWVTSNTSKTDWLLKGKEIYFWYSEDDTSSTNYLGMNIGQNQQSVWPRTADKFNSVHATEYLQTDFNINNESPKVIEPELAKNHLEYQEFTPGYQDFSQGYQGKTGKYPETLDIWIIKTTSLWILFLSLSTLIQWIQISNY